MLFHVGLHGIWNKHNAWVFSEEAVDSEAMVRWVEAQAQEWQSVQTNKISALDDIFCSSTYEISL